MGRRQVEAKLAKKANDKESLAKEVSELKVALLQAKADRARRPAVHHNNAENVTPNTTVRGPTSAESIDCSNNC